MAGSEIVAAKSQHHALCGVQVLISRELDGRVLFIVRAPLACAFVKNGKQFFSVGVRTIALYSETDEWTHADVQPEAPAKKRKNQRVRRRRDCCELPGFPESYCYLAHHVHNQTNPM